MNIGHAMAGLLVAAAAISPATASTQTSASGAGSGDWQFTAAIYGYLPDLTGKVVFPGDLGSSDIDVPIGDILSHLKMTFMGAFGAHNGQWGMSADALYMDLGGSKKRTRDFPLPGSSVPVSADLSVDVKAWVWTLAGEYRVVSNQAWTLDVLAGARSLYFNPSLDYRVAGPDGSIDGHKDSSGTAWDGIVGTRGRYTFGDHDRWFVPFYLDVGTGDTDLTWQAAAGVGYSYQWGDIRASWRYLNWNGKAGDPVADLTMSGPLLGIAWRW